MKVLLVAPPWEGLYGAYKPAARVGVLYPPLGLCYIAASLKAANHEVRLIDAEAEGFGIKDIMQKVAEFSPDIVGITSVSPLWPQAKKLCSAIKNRFGIKVILGGPHITNVEKEIFLEADFDYAIYGEGEGAFVELLRRIESGRDVSGMPGIIYRKSQEIIKENHFGWARDIDSIPIPDRSLLNHDRYLWSVPRRGILKFTTILTTRGCPYRCIFCSQQHMFGNKVRLRDASKVVDEIEHIIRDLGINHLIFIDDTLTLKRDRVFDICDGIERRGLKLTWEGWTHANTVDEELLSRMKEVGLVRLSFGIESGNEEVLRRTKKGTTLEDVRRAYRVAKKVGLETRGSVILGLPYDTKETVRDTIEFVKSLDDCDQAYFNIAMPYPGTEMREMAFRGEGGVRLLTNDYTELRRHGNVVMEVNDLSKETLLQLQKQAWLSFFLTPRRILYNFFRAGLKAGIINGWAFIRSFLLHKGRVDT